MREVKPGSASIGAGSAPVEIPRVEQSLTFDEFRTLMAEQDMRSEHQRIASVIGRLKKTCGPTETIFDPPDGARYLSPFEVPEGYFELIPRMPRHLESFGTGRSFVDLFARCDWERLIPSGSSIQNQSGDQQLNVLTGAALPQPLGTKSVSSAHVRRQMIALAEAGPRGEIENRTRKEWFVLLKAEFPQLTANQFMGKSGAGKSNIFLSVKAALKASGITLNGRGAPTKDPQDN